MWWANHWCRCNKIWHWFAVQILLIWRMMCLKHELLSHCCCFLNSDYFFSKIINITTVPNLILPLILSQLSNLQGVRDPTKNQVAPLTFWYNVNASPLRCVIWWTSCTMRTILYRLGPKGSFTNYVEIFFPFLITYLVTLGWILWRNSSAVIGENMPNVDTFSTYHLLI